MVGYVVAASPRSWPGTVAALSAKHPDSVVLVWQTSPADLLQALIEHNPRQVAFVAHPDEAGCAFVQAVHELTRSIDPTHPFSDVMWGVVTGSCEEDATAMAEESTPLQIRHVVSGSVEGADLAAFESGLCFDELVQYRGMSKAVGEEPREVSHKGEDSTMLIAAAVEDSSTDMIITSGHARETEWNIGFRFAGGQFRPDPATGSLHAFPVGGAIGPDAIRAPPSAAGEGGGQQHHVGGSRSREILASRKPKVYSAAGNCLMAHIPAGSVDGGGGCMALAWMKSAGVRQMLGYIEPTWYGYAGWGVHRYLWANVGALTFAEAYFANQQALQLRLMQVRDLTSNMSSNSSSSNGSMLTKDEEYRLGGAGISAACSFGEAEGERRGLEFDSNSTVFFGDPRWEARMVCPASRKDFYEIEIVPLKRSDCDGGAAASAAAAAAAADDDAADAADAHRDLRGAPPTVAGSKATRRFEVRVTCLRAGCWSPTSGDDKVTLPGRPPFILHGLEFSWSRKGTCCLASCSEKGTLRCSRCQAAWYCSKEHQKAAWKAGHKKSCVNPGGGKGGNNNGGGGAGAGGGGDASPSRGTAARTTALVTAELIVTRLFALVPLEGRFEAGDVVVRHFEATSNTGVVVPAATSGGGEAKAQERQPFAKRSRLEEEGCCPDGL